MPPARSRAEEKSPVSLGPAVVAPQPDIRPTLVPHKQLQKTAPAPLLSHISFSSSNLEVQSQAEAMPLDCGDDLQSMSFGSETISSISTASGSYSSSSSSSEPISSAADACLDAIRRVAGPDGSIATSDLRFIQRLGCGDIGCVYLAEVKTAGSKGGPIAVAAAKVMDKRELLRRNKNARAKTEKEILEMLEHPFLPRLYCCAESEKFACLLTEFCPGGDLHVLRQRQPGKRFDEHAVRFYAAEVVAALEYLHLLGIVYRDLKPENVLVRSDGHIMLTDFDLSLKGETGCSTAVQLVSKQYSPIPSSAPSPTHRSANPSGVTSCILPKCIVPAVSCFHPRLRGRKKPGRRAATGGLEFVAEPVNLRSSSFVGTHEYLAPEIVSGEGHGSTVDWWTLGVFVFELLYGSTPFKGSDHEMTLANIVARALEFPKEPAASAAVRDLIAGLLVKDPGKRLGSTLGATAIKRHPFFGGVNWALLRCTVPPHVPPPFTAGGGSSRDLSDDSCPGTPVEYY